MWSRCHGPEGKIHTDRKDLAGSYELYEHVIHWEQRRSMSASILGHNTRERARPFIRTTLMCVSWRRLSIVNLSVPGTTTRSPQSEILSSIVSSSLRRWYGPSSPDGHLSGQPRSTKCRILDRNGFVRVAILHCLESIEVDSIRETWTGCTLDSSLKVDSLLHRGRRERASAFGLSHPFRNLT